MYITIRKTKDINEKSKEVCFPLDEEQLSKICNDIGIETAITDNIVIVDSNDGDLVHFIKERNCNIDELNFLTKRLDSFDAKEKITFLASAVATGADTLKDLINLTYNTHCYSVISDFKNLDAVGKDIYLNEAGGATIDELNAVDGSAIVDKLMKHRAMQVVTPYGVVYQNRNEPELIYNGKNFPRYHWMPDIATVSLEYEECREYVYLPCPDSTIARAINRLAVENLFDCTVAIDSDYLPKKLIQLIEHEEQSENRVAILNEFANKFKELGNRESADFEKLMDYIAPESLVEIKVLLDHLYEFQLFDGIQSPKAYGQYMICESGHFEYDENLEDFIDFKRYGEERIKNESGAFTNKGYIVYHGYDPEIQNLLSKNLGIKMDKQQQEMQIKLYMPLRAITYDVENDYGFIEQSDYEEEISAHELLAYEDEILEALEKYKIPNEEKRGLMQYYDTHDSLNAKVAKYKLTVEEAKGELMGVAVLTLNAPLSEIEMSRIKDVITGQASDGFGEGFVLNEIKINDRGIYVSFWNSKDWSIVTAEELGLTDHIQTMGGIS